MAQTQSYRISGLTCSHCEESVKSSLSELKDVTAVDVSKDTEELVLTTASFIQPEVLQARLGGTGSRYQIHDASAVIEHVEPAPQSFWGELFYWKKAARNTLNCLIGCSIGDFGMIIFLQHYYPGTSMMWQMILAVIAGLITSISLETTILHVKEKMNWSKAFSVAMGMSFISMIGMEIAMNLTDFMVTGGKLALSDPGFWLAFIPAALAGFVAPLPYNYYKLKKYNISCH